MNNILSSLWSYFSIANAPSKTVFSLLPRAVLSGFINFERIGNTFSFAPPLISRSMLASLAMKLKGWVVSTNPSKHVTNIGSNERSNKINNVSILEELSKYVRLGYALIQFSDN